MASSSSRWTTGATRGVSRILIARSPMREVATVTDAFLSSQAKQCAAMLARRGDNDVAVLDRAVIALKQERPRRAFVAVDRATGDTGNLLVADDARPVRHDRHHPPNECDVVRIPLAGALRRNSAR